MDRLLTDVSLEPGGFDYSAKYEEFEKLKNLDNYSEKFYWILGELHPSPSCSEKMDVIHQYMDLASGRSASQGGALPDLTRSQSSLF